MPPRYFIGLTLPKDISKEISIVQYKLYDEKQLLKPLIPHITIVHPNALERISPMWLLPKLKQIQNSYMPLKIKLGPVAMFHGSNLHITVQSNNIDELYNECVNLLPQDAIAKHFIGKREFSPHITLAQAKPKKELNPKYINLYRQELKSLIGVEFTIGNLTKFEHTAPRQYQIKPL